MLNLQKKPTRRQLLFVTTFVVLLLGSIARPIYGIKEISNMLAISAYFVLIIFVTWEIILYLKDIDKKK
tara:strand:- start:225 stop:431 length:207 start_codon:yes stop_codon:yes gene_type:complete